MDLLLKGGQVLDPGQGLDGLFDVRLRSGLIAEIGQNLSAKAAEIRDCSGLMVVPGLIDVHLHLFNGMGATGADPDVFRVGSA
ncbi:MAG: hypothetical protein QGI09_11155 [Dehalococcoidia bacterium]|nr:hypothetical protein [Dehalococcoidia bacterium]